MTLGGVSTRAGNGAHDPFGSPTEQGGRAIEHDLPGAVAADLADYLAGRRDECADIDPEYAAAVDDLDAIRARAGASGCVPRSRGGAGGPPAALGDPAAVLRAVSALELIQACALVHDDLIDDSATRRGEPTVHVRFGGAARRRRLDGRPDALRRRGRDPARRPGPRLGRRHAPRVRAATRSRSPVPAARGRPCAPRCSAGSSSTCCTQSSGDEPRDRAADQPATRPPPTPWSARCTSGPRSRAPTTRADRRATAASAPTSASPSSCATTCSACSATRPSPASPQATTCARASGRCSSRWRRARTPTARPAAVVERAVGNPDLDDDGRRPRSARPWSPSAPSHDVEQRIAALTASALDALRGADAPVLAVPAPTGSPIWPSPPPGARR